MKQNVLQVPLKSHHIEGRSCLKYGSNEAHTCTYIPMYMHVDVHTKTQFITKILLLLCGLVSDQEPFLNHILKELSYESRQYLLF